MMALGAFVAWIWLPDIEDGVILDGEDEEGTESDTQSHRSGSENATGTGFDNVHGGNEVRRRGNGRRQTVKAMTWYKLRSKRLEVLARGRKWAVGGPGNEGEGQILGFRGKMGVPFSEWFGRKKGGS